jgi:hypothetical protein
MNKKVTAAIQRLNSILPLKENQQALSKPLRELHQAILHSFIEQGRSLNRDEMANFVNNIDDAIAIFKQYDLLVFDDNNEPIGTYPFTTQPRVYRVSVNGHTVHCMCALDALAVSPMFHLPTQINSRCHVTSRPISIYQNKMEISCDDQPLFFGINWNAASTKSCCANSLCTEMIFLAGDEAEVNWLSGDPDQRETFTLQEAVNFAADFFVPLMCNQ